jgi:hypothetical protein
MFSDVACADAQRAWADALDESSMLAMVRICSAAYCPKFATPRPVLCLREKPTLAQASKEWGELTQRCFEYEFGSGYGVLAKAVSIAEAPGDAVAKKLLAEPEPQRSPDRPWIDLTSTTMTLNRRDGGTRTWSYQGDVPEDALRATLLTEPGAPYLGLRASPEVMFLQLKIVMGVSSDAGFSNIFFSVIHDGGS